MPPVRLALTEDNISKLSEPPGNEEKERKLLEKMQNLSKLLKQVDDMLEEDTESRPSTRQGPPPTTAGSRRPDTSASRVCAPAPDGEPPKPPPTGRSDFSTCSQRELLGLPVNAGLDTVQYQGKQSHCAGIQRLRKCSNARAAQSSIGDLLRGD